MSGVGVEHAEVVARRPSVGGGTRVCGVAGAIFSHYVWDCCVHGRRCTGGNVIVISREIATSLRRNAVGDSVDSRLLESRSEMQG